MQPPRRQRQRTTPSGRRMPLERVLPLPQQPIRSVGLPETLLSAIETDPIFQVMTNDFHWIDPFTGDAVPAQAGRVEAAQAYLLASGVWQYSNPLTRQELDVIRWRLDLIPRLREEPRLRLFTRDGMWVNPYTGDLVPNIRREAGKITSSTVLDLARVLAACAQASTGLMLDLETLRNRVRSLSREETGGFPIPPEPTPRRGQPTIPDPLQRARDVQQRMLASMPKIDGYELAVHYAPCAMVGGDFYDCIELANGRRLFLVGDVSGHGVEAALVVASALSTLRLLSRQMTSSLDLLSKYNDEVRRDLVPGQFITLFAVELDPSTHQIICLCAGHHQALVLNPTSDAMVRRIGTPGMAIGLTDSATFRSSLMPMTLTLQPGDMLLQYTDGITEVHDATGQLFGDLRMCAAALMQVECGAQALVDGLAEAARAFAGGQMSDDVTAFAMARLADPEGLANADEWTWPLQDD